MAFLVIARLFLSFGRLRIGFRFRLGNLRGERMAAVYVIDDFGNVAKPFVVKLEIGTGIMTVLVGLVHLRGGMFAVNDDVPFVGRLFIVSFLPIIITYFHS